MRWTQKAMREVAQEERAALGLSPFDPLDPYALCREHGIDVYPLSALHGVDAAVAHFSIARVRSWSAALIPYGTARIIIENDAHAAVRRRSSIAHELGHHLLEHEFQGILLGEDHRRQFDPRPEKEATFLAGELLIPFPAVERMAFDRWSNERVAERYGVSTQFAQMQMKGQRVRAARAAAKFA